MSAKSGFTLIELLVVIAIMAIVGAYTLSNYRSFGEDQKLKNAVLDVVSLLRQAQSNATSGLKCQVSPNQDWIVLVIKSQNVLYLECKTSAGIVLPSRELSFPSGVSISDVSGGCINSTIISFTSLLGNASARCISPPNPINLPITITLINSKTGNTKQVIIEQGGRIYAQ